MMAMTRYSRSGPIVVLPGYMSGATDLSGLMEVLVMVEVMITSCPTWRWGGGIRNVHHSVNICTAYMYGHPFAPSP